ncbi:CPBP family intramembrane glutamic endopeptidase [Nigerium sp.]|uniref:CPBP family intramembrane glutamic endopeptidase n=1 Tax=Nigerium sp. TaxID=2042655 RepID=UPI0032221251
MTDTQIRPAKPAASHGVSIPALAGLSLLRPALLLLALGAVSLTLRTLGVAHAATWGPLSLNVAIVGVDVLTLLVVVRLLARDGQSLRGVIGRFRGADVAWGLLIALGLMIVLLAVTYAGNLLMYGGAPPRPAGGEGFRVPVWFGLWATLLMPVTIAFAEEVLFRGYLQPRWSARLGSLAGLVVTAVFFGLQHVVFAWGNPQAAVVRFAATFAGGLLLGLLARKFGRLWPLIIGHWLADVVGLGLPLLFAAVAA